MFFNEMGIRGRYINLSYPAMKFIVILTEKIYSFFRIKKEPPLTLYTLYLLRYSQILSVEKAIEQLGYRPKLTIREGVEKYVRHNRNN